MKVGRRQDGSISPKNIQETSELVLASSRANGVAGTQCVQLVILDWQGSLLYS
jgi:hypothetical protein